MDGAEDHIRRLTLVILHMHALEGGDTFVQVVAIGFNEVHQHPELLVVRLFDIILKIFHTAHGREELIADPVVLTVVQVQDIVERGPLVGVGVRVDIALEVHGAPSAIRRDMIDGLLQ